MPYTVEKPLADYSISQLVAVYNDIARYNGTPTRSATFRDKTAAIKAVQGQLTQANTEVDEDPSPIPGLARLRKSPKAEAVRQSVLKDQLEASLAVKDPTVEAPPVAKRGRVGTLTGNEVITVIALVNPKREGSASAARYNHYRTGMTVDQYGAACRDRKKAIRDVQWDLKAGFISLS